MNPLEIAYSGARCLKDLVQGDGSFKYRYDSQTATPLNGYNVLRHAGTIWSMLDVYRNVADKTLLEGGRKATHYLLDTYLRFFRDYNNACICEDNKIKLGGNALSTLTLLSLFELTQDHFLLAVAEQLCDFVLRQRLENGALVHKRYFDSGKISGFASMYYTGEALLALLALYRLTHRKQVLEAVVEIEKDLAAIDYGVEEQSHWMLYSLELLSHFQASSLSYRHAEKIVKHILDNPEYLSWERSTPIACRSEGLLAFVRMQRPESVDDRALCEKCLEQVQANLMLQLAFRLPDGSFVRGGKDRRRNEVRIDYIQHNTSSFLHYARLGLK
jgi:hypothetical protein